MNEDFLVSMREPPRREFADDLYKRINRPMYEQRTSYTQFPFRRAALVLGVFGLLLIVILLVSPGARAFADEQFRQIGALIFRPLDTDRSLAEDQAAKPQPTLPAPGDEDRPESTSLLEDASRLAGFEVLEPGYLPEGYQVNTVWSIDRRDSGVYVVSSFRNEAADQFLLLNQIQYTAGSNFEQTYGDNELLSDVTVGGTYGVWITGRLMTDPTDRTVGLQSDPVLHSTNWLVWQEGDITYTLFGNGLSQEEMIWVAESLK